MEEKIESFLKKYSDEQLRFFANNFFKVNLTQEEMSKIMPIVRKDYKEVLDEEKRSIFIDKIAKVVDQTTMEKLNRIAYLAATYYGIEL